MSGTMQINDRASSPITTRRTTAKSMVPTLKESQAFFRESSPSKRAVSGILQSYSQDHVYETARFSFRLTSPPHYGFFVRAVARLFQSPSPSLAMFSQRSISSRTLLWGSIVRRGLTLLCCLLCLSLSSLAHARHVIGHQEPPEETPAAPAGREKEAKGAALESLLVHGEYTIIPLPAFSYTRNESFYIGALAPTLRAREDGTVTDIIAPQYLFNPFVDNTFTLNYYGYPSDTVQYRAIASYSERVAKDFDLAYRDVGAGGGRYILGFQVNWFKNPFARFFGIGNETQVQDETNYTSREFLAKGTVGINLGPDFALLFTERYHEVRVENGILTTLLDTRAKIGATNLPGMEGARILGHQFMVRYDTRDNLLTPARGTYVTVSLELSQNLQPSEPDRWGRYIVDARHLIPHARGQAVFGLRFLMDGVTGDRIPFYERPTLGGETTLRAFGLSRFIDDWATVANIEERFILKEQKLFDHVVGLEIAPFLDMGRVSSNLFDQTRRIQFNPGMGFRLVQKPNVVGRLDVAYGRDGGNAYVGLDYPF